MTRERREEDYNAGGYNIVGKTIERCVICNSTIRSGPFKFKSFCDIHSIDDWNKILSNRAQRLKTQFWRP